MKENEKKILLRSSDDLIAAVEQVKLTFETLFSIMSVSGYLPAVRLRCLTAFLSIKIETEKTRMNITVYLGANEGNDPSLRKVVQELGTWIGCSGNALVYGGSKSGLMGALADSVLNAGGEVTGVEPEFFIINEFQHERLTKLIVTKDMSERKNKMIELGEAFIAFPGGTGTLEEIAEVMSKVSLKHLNAPCILYNLNGYYDSLKALLDHMIEKNLSSKERQEGIYFAKNLEAIKRILGL